MSCKVDEQKKCLTTWIKNHKKELICAGISIGTMTVIILGIKNRNNVQRVWRALKSAINDNDICENFNAEKIESVAPIEKVDMAVNAHIPITYREPFIVREHPRNLPDGRKASDRKMAEAMEKGIKLLPNQTLVDEYMKGEKTA